jgi:phosphatidate cytidylyltransferase
MLLISSPRNSFLSIWHNIAGKTELAQAGAFILKNLGIRTLSGVILLAIVLAAIWLRGPLLVFAVAVAVALAAHEFYTMVRRAGYQPWYPAGVALALLLALRGYLGGDLFAGIAYAGPGVAAEIIALTLVMILVLTRQGLEWLRASQPARGSVPVPAARSPYLGWADLGLTFAGAIYTGGLLGYAPLLASVQETPTQGGGQAWMLMVLLGTAACDTGAYLVGSLIGRHKMIPHISPGKTWEGLVGGFAGAILAAIVLAGFLKITLPEAIALGFLICLAAVCGDLSESFMKRACGVKDSGHLIPGHGGILDRIDSILFVLLAVYWFVIVRG